MKRAWIAVTVIAIALLALLVAMRVAADRLHERAMALLPSSPALERYKAASGAEQQDEMSEASVSNPAKLYADLATFWESGQLSPEAWDELKRLVRNNEAAVLDPTTWGPHAEFLETHQDLIAQIRALATSDGPLISVDFSQAIRLDFSHVEEAFKLVMLLQADALYHAAQGDYDTYASDMAAMFAFADKMGEVPVLQAQSGRLVIGLMTSRIAAVGPDGGHLSSQHIRILENAAVRAADRQPLADSVAGDALLAMNTCRAILNDDSRSMYMTAVNLGPPLSAKPSLVSYVGRVGYRLIYLSPVGAPLRSADEEALAGSYASLPQIVGQPYYAAHEDWDGWVEQGRNIPDRQLLTQEILPTTGSSWEYVMADQARLEASVNLMRIGFELECCRSETGTLPQSIAQIQNRLGGAVPVDPFTGAPFVYRPSGDTFVLYSVGENLTDDGGTHDLRDGDIVWRGKAPQK
jgi:hypothetical protein